MLKFGFSLVVRFDLESSFDIGAATAFGIEYLLLCPTCLSCLIRVTSDCKSGSDPFFWTGPYSIDLIRACLKIHMGASLPCRLTVKNSVHSLKTMVRAQITRLMHYCIGVCLLYVGLHRERKRPQSLCEFDAKSQFLRDDDADSFHLSWAYFRSTTGCYFPQMNLKVY